MHTASARDTMPEIHSPLDIGEKGYALIAGPCSAENPQMVDDTARQLSKDGIKYFRAGIWKPRSHPGQFEGRGQEALTWVADACLKYGLTPIVEIATPEHISLCAEHGIISYWIGARTAVNPFAVQALADAIEKSGFRDDISVFVKNPVNPDLELWIGALQRIYRAGVRRLGAIHRGFSSYDSSPLRNAPYWRLPLELMRREPRLTVVCDPSHIAGRRELVPDIAQEALDMGFKGIMTEVHPDPDKALSDASQQLSPAQFKNMADRLILRRGDTVLTELQQMRCRIDEIDSNIIRLIGERMEIADRIAVYKKQHDMPVLQPQRYDAMITERMKQAAEEGLDSKFTRLFMSLIHEESVRRQISIINRTPEHES